MNKFFIKILYVNLILFLFSFSVSADVFPTFKTISATNITQSTAMLRGNFNSSNLMDLPYAWFQYGEDQDALDKHTDWIPQVSGKYTKSQIIYNLKPSTRYYYRTVLRFDKALNYGYTFSFVTLEDNTLKNEYISNTDEYKDINNVSFINGVENNNNKVFSFFDFFSWFNSSKKDDSNNIQNNFNTNLVHTEEEINVINKEREDRLKKLSKQERYNNSAANDDELGEIVNYNTRYKNTYNNKKITNSRSLSYPVLLFIVIILIFIILLLRVFYLKFKRKNKFDTDSIYMNKHEGNNNSSEKYYIPIRKDFKKQYLNDDIKNNKLKYITESPVKTQDNNIKNLNIKNNNIKPRRELGKTFFRKPPVK